ncbi:MAG: DUF4153 domain-containing protein [Cellvibrionales bacterium]|nr:DUF4153 domain-containing protein [Cellvibrionales bacterium]
MPPWFAKLKPLFPLAALRQTVLRFPLAAVCSVLFCGLFLLCIHRAITPAPDTLMRLWALLACGFLSFGLARLIAEGRGAGPLFEYLLGAGLFALLALAIFNHHGDALGWLLFLLIPALLLALGIGPYMAGPYLRLGDELAFWFYNRRLWFGVAVALAAGLFWAGGLSAALTSIGFLFEVEIAPEAYADILVLTLGLFAPLYALSRVPHPTDLAAAPPPAMPTLAFVLNWVLAPLVLIHGGILYAYFIRLGFERELPYALVGFLVSSFAGLGILSFLVGYALRDAAGPLLTLVRRCFFPALLIPAAMQGLAVALRIAEHGVTEPRYLVALAAIGYATLAALFTLRRPSLRLIPATLAALLLIGAIGPFSAPKVAERSQLARLEAVLTENGLLVDGQLREAGASLDWEERAQISSILDFLHQRGHIEQIAPWLPPESESVRRPAKLAEIMGFAHISRYDRHTLRSPRPEQIYWDGTPTSEPFDVGGFDRLIPGWYIDCREDGCSAAKPWRDTIQPDDLHLEYADGILRLEWPAADGAAAENIEFDLEAFIAARLAAGKVDDESGSEPMVLEQQAGSLRARLLLRHLTAVAQPIESEAETPTETTATRLAYRLQEVRLRILLDTDAATPAAVDAPAPPDLERQESP